MANPLAPSLPVGVANIFYQTYNVKNAIIPVVADSRCCSCSPIFHFQFSIFNFFVLSATGAHAAMSPYFLRGHGTTAGYFNGAASALFDSNSFSTGILITSRSYDIRPLTSISTSVVCV